MGDHAGGRYDQRCGTGAECYAGNGNGNRFRESQGGNPIAGFVAEPLSRKMGVRAVKTTPATTGAEK